MTTPLRPAHSNRRRRVRHRIQTPAYATFAAESKGAMLDLHEIVDLSEEGIAIQCITPLETSKRVNLCLDLAGSPGNIYTAGQVIWSNETGRAGLRFSELPPAALFRLREWLFLNAMAGVATADDVTLSSLSAAVQVPPTLPSYTDTLAAVTAVQREVEAIGSDLSAALQLIASRAQTLVRASGAAIALADANSDSMVCRATSGPDAPPIGARLQVGSGFSGECVKTGKLLRCDDAETDSRVDRESCRALGIRSILAAPVRVGNKSIGIIETFSAEPSAFNDDDGGVLQRLADAVIAAVNRAARAEDLPALKAEPPAERFAPQPGSVLFASADGKKIDTPAEKKSEGITLPRSHLILLICCALTISTVLGVLSAPWIQAHIEPWIQAHIEQRGQLHLSTVLASSQPLKTSVPSPSGPAVETATLEQLQQMAENGDSKAENMLGLRYVTGDGVKQDERAAIRWFTKAAEQGNVAAQSKLGSLYFRGRDIPQDLNRAYFWMVLARANGDETSKALAPVVTASLTRAQVTAIELDASQWVQQHGPAVKPAAGH